MKKLYINKLFYIFLLVFIILGIYLIISYAPFLEIKFIVAIILLFLIFFMYRYANSDRTIIKILKILLICSGLFYSVMIISNRFLYFRNLETNRSEISTKSLVNFEKNNFQTSLKKAKKENRLIFLDIYTGWCSPCLQFSKTVLRDKEISQLLNDKFINIEYDGEVGEGIEITKKYGQGYFPTILILDSNGNIKEDVCKQDTPDINKMKAILEKYK